MLGVHIAGTWIKGFGIGIPFGLLCHFALGYLSAPSAASLVENEVTMPHAVCYGRQVFLSFSDYRVDSSKLRTEIRM